MEKLSLVPPFEPCNQAWQLIEPANYTNLTPRSSPLMCPISSTKIVIAGGSGYLGDIFMLNTTTDRVEKVGEDG